jgi:flagellar biogenesis protein FliO
MVLNEADAVEETSEEAVAVALATRVVVVEVEEAALVVVVAADELDLINVLVLFPCTARNKNYIYLFNQFPPCFQKIRTSEIFIN